jgi:hypothetical protein
MAGNHPSSISYAMTRVQPSLSTSPRLRESSEVSLMRVGRILVVFMVVGRKMRRHLYIQLIENRFTGSLMLRGLSIVIPILALTLDQEVHYKYTEIHLTKRMLDTASQTGMVKVPTTE